MLKFERERYALCVLVKFTPARFDVVVSGKKYYMGSTDGSVCFIYVFCKQTYVVHIDHNGRDTAFQFDGCICVHIRV